MNTLKDAAEAALAAVSAAADGRKVGIGCPAASGSGGDLRRDNGSVEWLITKSPRLALSRALMIDMVPFSFMVPVNFAAAGLGTQTEQGPNKPIGRDVLLHAIDIDIQNPNAFTADEFKPLSDFFFGYTSGIQAALNIDGFRKFRVSYAPLRSVARYCSSDEPWVVLEEQIPSMDLNVTTPLPYAQTTINVAFIGKTPSVDTTYRMSPIEALDCLEKLGYCVDVARKLWGC